MTRHRLRHSTGLFLITALNCLLLIACGLHATVSRLSAPEITAFNRSLAKDLRLTDLCLFTEARYTRHPAMADLHAPFQEHPGAFDHFPSGSLLTPVAKNSGNLHAQH